MGSRPDAARAASAPPAVASPSPLRRAGGAAWIAGGIAFVAGASTMTTELAAVRLLAPWFGTSSAVWTNVIGVVLVALAGGYLCGARLARGADPGRSMGRALLAAGVASAWLPALARPVARAFLPDGLALEEAAECLRWGSLASALCLFAPAALLLGMIAPLATEVVQRARGGAAGSAGGIVLAASTLGSLLGTFATTYLLVPRAGLSATFVGSGSALLLAGLALTLPRRSVAVSGAALVALLPSLAASRAGSAGAAPGLRLLEARETPYQSARVVERTDGDLRLRFLQVNESFGSFQSVWQPATGPLPPGHYYDAFAIPPLVAHRAGTWRLAVLGLGAGTAWRVLEGVLPADLRLDSVGVEIDPGIVALGRRWMDLAPAGTPGRVVLADVDARAALHWIAPRLDQIVVDAYQNQMEIPPQLASLEFFADCREALADGGWLTLNVGAFGLDDPVLEAVGATVAQAFAAPALALRVPFSRNVLLLARRAVMLPEGGAAGWSTGAGAVDRMLSAMSLPGMWRWIRASDGVVLTDDRNPIESLQRRSIEQAAGRAGT